MSRGASAPRRHHGTRSGRPNCSRRTLGSPDDWLRRGHASACGKMVAHAIVDCGGSPAPRRGNCPPRGRHGLLHRSRHRRERGARRPRRRATVRFPGSPCPRRQRARTQASGVPV